MISHPGAKDALEVVMQSGKPFQTSVYPRRQNGVSACNCSRSDSIPADIRSFRIALNALDTE
jgi:hypothetical protein